MRPISTRQNSKQNTSNKTNINNIYKSSKKRKLHLMRENCIVLKKNFFTLFSFYLMIKTFKFNKRWTKIQSNYFLRLQNFIRIYKTLKIMINISNSNNLE